MKLLIDADFIVYKACAAAEDEIDWGDDVIVVSSRFSEAMKIIERELKRIRDRFFEPEMILFFSDSENFRKKIDPEYKGQRTRKKPCGYKRALKELHNRYKTVKMSGLEADDALGIYATTHEDCVVVSPDKDLRQIPGTLYDLSTIRTITPDEGLLWFLTQTLSGDCTDGYSGVPGYGITKSTKLFDNKGLSWETVVWAYESKGLTEEDALKNARLARILQKTDYDKRTKKPILWDPSSLPVKNND